MTLETRIARIEQMIRRDRQTRRYYLVCWGRTRAFARREWRAIYTYPRNATEQENRLRADCFARTWYEDAQRWRRAYVNLGVCIREYERLLLQLLRGEEYVWETVQDGDARH